ncbi:hypothetical protein B0I35DRAFT_481417 [Stachybotrys elegans]|uniref:RING-type domain-containing protein n=1 Tax=Stachybotrys elegans TaxID=80388 RepID=A0A8K0WN32_9HYPO|nr:hypothetical protein B0I35DRAFT_481417 [Stachybotrys elegans]
MRGAWVRFGDGARVTQAFFPSEFSMVCLKNVPSFYKGFYLPALLRYVDPKMPPAGMQWLDMSETKKPNVVIAVRDPKFAARAVKKHASNSNTMAVKQLIVPSPVGSGLRQVCGGRVVLSWPVATRTARLFFHNWDDAVTVHKKFQEGTYRINEYTATPTTGTPVIRFENLRPYLRVEIGGCVGVTNVDDILDIILPTERPYKIVLGDLVHAENRDQGMNHVYRKLCEFGRIRQWKIHDQGGGPPEHQFARADALFLDEASAQNAVAYLKRNHDITLSGKGVRVALIITVKRKIPTKLYRLLMWWLGGFKASCRARNMRLHFKHPTSEAVIITLAGLDRNHVAQAQARLDTILDGQVISLNGKSVWPTALKMNANIKRCLNAIGVSFGVMIAFDCQSSRLRVIGQDDKFKGTAEAVTQLLQQLTLTSYRLPLDEDIDCQWALYGGVYALQARFGEINATLDRAPRCIRFHGSMDELAMAKRMMIGRKLLLDPRPDTLKPPDCIICFTEAEEPIRTSCGHIYCSQCFAAMCLAEKSTTKEFGIVCQGDSSTCSKILGLQEIQSSLSPEAFEELLQSSFDRFIQRDPERYRNCPTPECTQVYCLDDFGRDSPRLMTCAACLQSLCGRCCSSHPGQPCERYNYIPKQTMKKLGIHSCPNCKVPIQKYDGCNRVLCSRCGINICWVCFKGLASSKACYDHLKDAHNAIWAAVDG